MPSKKSKRSPTPKRAALATVPSRPSAWKAARTCSEESLEKLAQQLASQLRAGDRVLLEGPMGAGKTTFARALLRSLRIHQPAEGSPTFAIAHEYEIKSPTKEVARSVVHIDFYRIGSEAEIDERGIPDYFWDPEKIVISEWTSLWPTFEASVLKGGRNWRVALDFSQKSSGDFRDLQITLLGLES
jgi:tRNA threonylcarbamoyl adenosine modification protein YjeE